MSKFYLIEPLDKRYKTMIAYADDEQAARNACPQTFTFIPAGSASTPQIDETYMRDISSKCMEISVTIHSQTTKQAHINYDNKSYNLTLHHAQRFKS